MSPKLAFLVILGILALSLVGGSFVYYTASSRLSQEADDISQLKAELDITELKIVNASQASADLQRLSFIDTIATSVLPPAKIQSTVVAELTAFAESSGVVTMSVSFDPTSDQQPTLSQTRPLADVPGVNALPMGLSVRGNFGQILNFLEKTEQNRRKMQIDKISLTPDPETGDIIATININVYIKV